MLSRLFLAVFHPTPLFLLSRVLHLICLQQDIWVLLNRPIGGPLRNLVTRRDIRHCSEDLMQVFSTRILAFTFSHLISFTVLHIFESPSFRYSHCFRPNFGYINVLYFTHPDGLCSISVPSNTATFKSVLFMCSMVITYGRSVINWTKSCGKIIGMYTWMTSSTCIRE